MNMKPLYRRTTLLLRTALSMLSLFGMSLSADAQLTVYRDRSNYSVTHRESYLKEKTNNVNVPKTSGLAEYNDDWYDYPELAPTKYPDGHNDRSIQKTNKFEITHYLKNDDTRTYFLPTELGCNDQVYFQRFYNYDDPEETESVYNIQRAGNQRRQPCESH